MAEGIEDLKKAAAKRAVEYVRDGMVLGLGTGSTTKYAIEFIGDMVDSGADIVGVPTSKASEAQAHSLGIPLVDISEVEKIDLTIDGADEIDPDLDLIKGLGGALLREKVVASLSQREIIIADERKDVPLLGTRSPLPVEVTKFGYKNTMAKLRALGCEVQLRTAGGGPFVSDNGNYIVDCRFPDGIKDKSELEIAINNIPGVVENGLFIGLANMAIIAMSDGRIVVRER